MNIRYHKFVPDKSNPIYFSLYEQDPFGNNKLHLTQFRYNCKEYTGIFIHSGTKCTVTLPKGISYKIKIKCMFMPGSLEKSQEQSFEVLGKKQKPLFSIVSYLEERYLLDQLYYELIISEEVTFLVNPILTTKWGWCCFIIESCEEVSKKNNFIYQTYQKEKIENIHKIEEEYQKKMTHLQSVPRVIQLEHTTYCNLECIACPHYFEKNKNANHLDMRVVEKLRPILSKVEQIQLNGGGEPFLANDIEHILETYASYGVRITATTNLMHLTPKIMNILGKDFYSLNISCDGATKSTFEGIRKNSNFDIFVENVRNVRKLNEKLRLVMGVTMMRQNIRELPDIIICAKKLGFNKVVIGRMMPRPNALPHTFYDDVLKYPRVTNNYLALAREVASQINIEAIIPPDISIQSNELSFDDEIELIEKIPMFPSKDYQLDLVEKNLRTLKKNAGTKSIEPIIEPKERKIFCSGNCDWLFENIFINSKGEVATCCQKANFSMGNLLDSKTFEEIWNGRGFCDLRKAFWNEYIPQHCYGCQFITQQSLRKLSVNENINLKSFRLF